MLRRRWTSCTGDFLPIYPLGDPLPIHRRILHDNGANDLTDSQLDILKKLKSVAVFKVESIESHIDLDNIKEVIDEPVIIEMNDAKLSIFRSRAYKEDELALNFSAKLGRLLHIEVSQLMTILSCPADTVKQMFKLDGILALPENVHEEEEEEEDQMQVDQDVQAVPEEAEFADAHLNDRHTTPRPQSSSPHSGSLSPAPSSSNDADIVDLIEDVRDEDVGNEDVKDEDARNEGVRNNAEVIDLTSDVDEDVGPDIPTLRRQARDLDDHINEGEVSHAGSTGFRAQIVERPPKQAGRSQNRGRKSQSGSRRRSRRLAPIAEAASPVPSQDEEPVAATQATRDVPLTQEQVTCGILGELYVRSIASCCS